jgi:tRNA-2-methylthio-N6-dimethylallyladenosine synthase
MPTDSTLDDTLDRAENSAQDRAARKPRYWIKTYGCQMNVHDSEVYAGLLTDMGYEEAAEAEDADVILVNTCSVRERAEDKLFSQLGVLRRMKADIASGATGQARELKIGVTGCIAQQRGEGIIARDKSVDFVIGTRAIHSLPQVLHDVRCGKGPQVMTEDLVQFEAPGALRQDRVKAFVTIMEGCNNYCSFCIVPATRGLEVYRSAGAIVDEVRGLGLRGYREVTLLGQNVNSWVDPETGMDFPGLLVRLDQALRQEQGADGVQRIRFLTSHPKDLSPRLTEAMGDCERIAKHLHLPVQSGSNRVLHEMNRHYTADKYQSQVDALRRRVPGVGLSTDLIVGFPGETDADFQATLDLVRRVEYDSFYSFEYSPRPGTAATRYVDDVPAEEKRARLLELQRIGRQIQERHNAAWVGKEATVLVEGVSKRSAADVTGRTSSNHIVNLPGTADLVGELVDVRIDSHGGHSLYGQPLSQLS